MMNERIRELEVQCWEERHYGPPWFDADKFAELIVRECMDNLAWHGHDEAVRQLEWFLSNKIGN
jgi:hypothetical protein